MKTVKSFILFLVTVCLASCGGSGLKPTSNKIQGPLGKFFEVVDRNYSLKDGQVAIEFKRIAEGGPKDASWSSSPTFTVELLDADGNVVASDETDVVFDEDPLEGVFHLVRMRRKQLLLSLMKLKGLLVLRCQASGMNLKKIHLTSQLKRVVVVLMKRLQTQQVCNHLTLFCLVN